ncbi:MAG TPA: formimidoylglutamate deiminase [Acidimicrobiia bacterium]|nr:formimidoylglutamate deiminase [Acidimicrobiia bacterium]
MEGRLSEIPTDSASATTTWVADAAWLGGPGLVRDVQIRIREGRFASLSTDEAPPGTNRLRGVVLPGLVNAHSHAFHRLLRGRTHRQGGDFWLWRERMYQVAGSLTPEGYERLATAVYVEMAMAGITTVGEFHYLHHQIGGVPYEDPNEMGHALVRAARSAGIRIGLLDTGYFTSGFDDRPLTQVQTRFRDGSPGEWLDRAEEIHTAYTGAPDVVIGLAPHSVRAVPEAGLIELAKRRDASTPTHVHVSEQPAENRECLDATTLTPTGLLRRVGLLGASTTLVHGTHLSTGDIESIGASGAMVCYCATTERDLADGIGPASELDQAGASICVGSDSHAVIDLFEEMRGVELHTRLATGTRGVFAPDALVTAATTHGARSLGFPDAGLQAGAPADFIVVSTDSPRLVGMDFDTTLDTIVFAATAADVSDVFVAGDRVVESRRHPRWDSAKEGLIDPGR